MTVFGRIGESNLWVGRVLRRDRHGVVVQEGTSISYLRYGLFEESDERIGDARLWRRWQNTLTKTRPKPPIFFDPPEAATAIEVVERPTRRAKPDSVPRRPPPGPMPGIPPPTVWSHTIRVDSKLIIRGASTPSARGLNISVDGDFGGVQQDDAELDPIIIAVMDV